MTEYHRLSNTDDTIEISKSIELFVLILTFNVELFDVVQTLLSSLETNGDWVWNYSLGK